MKSVLCNFAVIQVLPFLNNAKDLDPSYKMDLDFWDCFGREKLCLISEEIRYTKLSNSFISKLVQTVQLATCTASTISWSRLYS